MKKITFENLGRSKKGQMPFALIAVTLLLLGSAYGAVYAYIENSEENTESLAQELTSMGVGMTETKYTVEAALGNIINELSRENTGGTLAERMDSFDEKVDTWFSSNFPMSDRGITARVAQYDVDLNVETLKMSSGDKFTDPSRPSYLRATGYMNVDFISAAGTSSRTVDISADGTSGLPFVVERASEFELSVSGDESALTQLISYQLSSLAQQRVLSGYGAVSEGGERGTSSIITEKDVNDAYRNALSIIEMICFRDTGNDDPLLESAVSVDAAEMLAMRDGYIEMDLSAIFSQTLLSMIDTLVIQWMDYFMLDKAVYAMDVISDSVRRCWNALVSFIDNDDRADAGQYLKDLMQNLGYAEKDYRFLFDSPSISVTTNAMDIVLTAGSSSENVTIPEMDILIPFPETDIVSWNGWDHFINEYHEGRNDLMESFRNIIKTIAIELSSSTDLGIIRIDVDAYDGSVFSQTLSESITKALNEQRDGVEMCMERTIRDSPVCDPLFIAMYERIVECRNEIFCADGFEKTMRLSIEKDVTEYLNRTYGTVLDPTFVDEIVDRIMESEQVSDAVEGYNEKIDTRIRFFRDILTQIPKDNESVIKNILVDIARRGMCAFDLYPLVESNMNGLCQEVTSYNDMNAHSGLTEFNGTKGFTLYDGDENLYEEFMDIRDGGDVIINITTPQDNKNQCVHYVGLDDHTAAPYTSVFSVRIKADVEYSILSSSAVLSALGTYDARFEDNFYLDTVVDIPCVSGWALAGVEYRSSTDFLDDAWQFLLKALEPLLEPLRKVYGMLRELFDLCGSAMVEISDYVSELVMKFYEAVEEPVAMIQKFIDDTLQDLIDNVGIGLDIGLTSQSVTLEYFGMKLTVQTKLATLVKNTKTLVKITLTRTVNDTEISGSVELRKNPEDGFIFIGNGYAKTDGWNIDLALDPLMKTGSTLINIDGKIRNVEFEAVMPQLVQYEKIGLRVSDIPGIGGVISNIPLPIPGMKGSLDVGLELKYNLPVKTGLLINEFESNPAGSDNGTEWVELLNSTNKAIDLKDYVLLPGSNAKKAFTIGSLVLPPGGKTVITFERQTLNNSKSSGEKSGDRITLVDPNGKNIDQTPWKSDSSNNDRTWQRSIDGYTEWTFAKGTPGSKNGGSIPGGVLMRTFIIDCFRSAGEKVFEEMGNKIKSTDSLALFLQKVIETAFENIIKSIANSIVSASVFIELEITDYAETQHNGIRVSLEIGSEFIEDGLTWLIGEIDCISKYAANDMDPAEIVYEDSYLRTTVYTGMGAPHFLDITDIDTDVVVGMSVSVNIAGLQNILGKDVGRWKASIGIVMEDVPTILIPAKLKADKTLKADLWLLRVDFQEAED
ncbi:MAG: lamin tail domain-containing protein [Candidatus Methanomethylophilaceae archaeon]